MRCSRDTIPLCSSIAFRLKGTNDVSPSKRYAVQNRLQRFCRVDKGTGGERERLTIPVRDPMLPGTALQETKHPSTGRPGLQLRLRQRRYRRLLPLLFCVCLAYRNKTERKGTLALLWLIYTGPTTPLGIHASAAYSVFSLIKASSVSRRLNVRIPAFKPRVKFCLAR